jgi:hypothetical protein
VSLCVFRSGQVVTEKEVRALICLQLLLESFMDFVSDFFLPGNLFIMVVIPVLFIFLTLTAFEMFHILVYLLSPLLSVVMIALILLLVPLFAKIQLGSEGLLEDMRRRPIQLLHHTTDNGYDRREWLKRRLRAFRPLGVRVAFFGRIDVGTPAIMMDQLINNVLLLLETWNS